MNGPQQRKGTFMSKKGERVALFAKRTKPTFLDNRRFRAVEYRKYFGTQSCFFRRPVYNSHNITHSSRTRTLTQSLKTFIKAPDFFFYTRVFFFSKKAILPMPKSDRILNLLATKEKSNKILIYKLDASSTSQQTVKNLTSY